MGEEGRRSKSDEALSLSFNPIVRVGGREMLSSRTQLGGGDIWLSDDPILMLPIVARSLARLSHASSGAAAMTKMAAIHKCFVILSSFRPRARSLALVRVRPSFDEGSDFPCSSMLATISEARFWRKHIARKMVCCPNLSAFTLRIGQSSLGLLAHTDPYR